MPRDYAQQGYIILYDKRYLSDKINPTPSKLGYAVAQLVAALRYKPKGRGFDSRRSQWSHCGPGVDSASNRNKYQKSFLGVKMAGA